jgi:hypothetical protein
MKRRILNMDPEEFSKLKYNGAGKGCLCVWYPVLSHL